MCKPLRIWRGPPSEVFEAGRKVGLRIVFIQVRPGEVFIPDESGYCDDKEEYERRLFRRFWLFHRRVKRELGLDVMINGSPELLGPYTACFFGYAIQGISLERPA